MRTYLFSCRVRPMYPPGFGLFDRSYACIVEADNPDAAVKHALRDVYKQGYEPSVPYGLREWPLIV